ncbi:MAG: helix-turn-helix transcriptional regulator [Alphaproteobacteria bacterium]
MDTSRKSKFAMLDGSLLARKGHARPAMPTGGDNGDAVTRAEAIAEAEAHHTPDVQHNLAELIVRPMAPANPMSAAGADGATDPTYADDDFDVASGSVPFADTSSGYPGFADAESRQQDYVSQDPGPRGHGLAAIPVPAEIRFGLMPRTWPGTTRHHAATVMPRGLDAAMAATYIGVPRRTFARLVRDGKLPGPLPFGGRKVWDRKVLDRALDELSGIEPAPHPAGNH